jgi:hypothetical protein
MDTGVTAMTARNGQDPGTDGPEAQPHRPRPARVDSSTRVNVALPFSTLKIQEPSGPLIELTALVADLADLMATAAPGPQAEDLRRRARDLTHRGR